MSAIDRYELVPAVGGFLQKRSISARYIGYDIGKANAPEIELITWARASNHLSLHTRLWILRTIEKGETEMTRST
jgi:hypothetical protein